ncbi:glycosyltransferase family 2 protein [Rhizobium sp. SSA_523]|uniref:glycosyltransferase family 2 protein n=1 Tax=Rhizobium sp. SSA_523 TaxID=2952477 RepID=UPI0020909DFB|nr:glycosyltransferase family 2 protein [Rhizobium sp. SSA_523]MCO5733012.1 glycosyltransferase [Rhizobium sp. SSA_523]WKC23893.1 glycosyltransferase family 2 protein [Rhizobium sp. SSA_523]
MVATTPILSICIPTYNRRPMLERSVRFHLDVFRKLGISFEMVIVDDRSTDGTHEFLQGLQGVPEISHYRRVKNSGFLSNYGFAMQRARGKYALFLGDDDLLIPEKVLEYLRLLEQDPSLGMIQAPWMLVDERDGGRDMQPFYHIPGPQRFRQGQFQEMLEYILQHHVFPEFLIIRRDVLQRSISSLGPFIFWAFLYTTRALSNGDILFLPAPFARVTGIAADENVQQGKKETMFQWDTYLGGLEYLASHARISSLDDGGLRLSFHERFNQFMLIRKSVALRLHIAFRNWPEAYIMYHRMAAYHPSPAPKETFEQICLLAAIVTALTEASGYSGGPVIVDPLVNDEALQLIPDHLKSVVTRHPGFNQEGPRSWLVMHPDFAAQAGPTDGVFELRHYIAQFT